MLIATSLVAFIIVIGVLIFVHELGHFLVAKAVGIQVLRFSLGFGRPILAWKRGETEYWISWIPLGGYVKMAGLEEEPLEGGKSEGAVDPERTFDRKPLWARMAVILAGVTMNLLFASAVYTGLALSLGEPRLAIMPIDSVDAARLPPGAAALARLGHGDVIARINGDSVETWDELAERLLDGPDTLRIEVAGSAEPIVVTFSPPGEAAARARTVGALRPLLPATIGVVTPGQPAARAGLRLGDVVIRTGSDSVRSWDELVRRVRASPGRPLDLDVRRGDSLVTITVTPEAQERDSAGRTITLGVIGAAPDDRWPTLRSKVGVGRALGAGVERTATQVSVIAVALKRLVFGQASTRELGGPILIAQMSGQMIQLGLERFLLFMAFFSVSLAVLNLLPIPVLDGGQAVFLLAEAVLRRPLPVAVRMRLSQIGLLVILGIMALALANDVLRIIPR